MHQCRCCQSHYCKIWLPTNYQHILHETWHISSPFLTGLATDVVSASNINYWISPVCFSGWSNSIYNVHIITFPFPHNLEPSSVSLCQLRLTHNISQTTFPFCTNEITWWKRCKQHTHTAMPWMCLTHNLSIKTWRFSAVVASFVARTKLLNVEPG